MTRSTVGIGNVASVVEGGDEERFVAVGRVDDEEVETLFEVVLLVAMDCYYQEDSKREFNNIDSLCFDK